MATIGRKEDLRVGPATASQEAKFGADVPDIASRQSLLL
eukprot:gene10903-50627_t